MVQKINIPLLSLKNTGVPFHILVVPSLQFLVDSEFTMDDFKETNSSLFTLNAHLRLGLKFDKFDIDIRWERWITNSESKCRTDFQDTELTFDSRTNQFILSVAYRFGKVNFIM
jgi:hypothetical protein